MNEFDAIWDAVAQAGKQMAREHKIAEKKAQIKSVTKRECGNCGLWMTSHCKPEKEHGQFKSMSSWACKDFGFCSDSINMRDKWTKELEAMEAAK